MNNKKIILPLFAVALLGGAATAGVVSYASAQTATGVTATTSTPSGDHRGPGVAGTVTAVSGSTITLTGKDGKTYTIDATKAAISKTTTIDVSGVAVGDTLMVGGTVSGTSVAADHIMDGKMPEGMMGMGTGKGEHGRGPGEGVVGTISAINGTTLSVTAKDGTVYTVDASSAKVMKGTVGAKPTESAVSNIAVNDSVHVMGTKNGTSVTAKMIMDGVFGRGAHTGTKTN